MIHAKILLLSKQTGQQQYVRYYSPAFDFTPLARFGRGDGGEGVTNNLGESCSNEDLKNLILGKFSELDKKMEVGLARMDQKLEVGLGDVNKKIQIQ